MAISVEVGEKTALKDLADNGDTPPNSNEDSLEETFGAPVSRSYRKFYLIAGTALLLGAVLCVLGGMFVSRSKDSEERNTTCPSSGSRCAYSEEAKRVKLPEFLVKVKKVYYQLHPDSYAWEVDVDEEKIKENLKQRYSPYDAHPLKLKEKTDRSLSLLEELNNINADIDKLKPRELKALEQLRHFLQHNFGVAYGANYYNGDWMMGPNYFCAWQSICQIFVKISSYAFYAKPSSYKELEIVMERIMKHKGTIDRYRKNIQLGVKAGMVRSIEDCRSGIDALKEKSKHLSQSKDPESVLQEEYTTWFRPGKFLVNMPSDDLKLWVMKQNKTAMESVQEALVKGFGQPMLELINYLEYDHVRHCLPSDVSSGLVSLPVDYVYFDGNPTEERTTKVLPTGEKLNGKKSYERIVSYFTTIDTSVDEIYRKGKEQKELFYNDILKIALSITNTTNINKAVKLLKTFLSLDSQWHNKEPFPANESNSIAFETCVDEESAKLYCPVRYAALEKWKATCREIMAFIHPQFIYAFHVTGRRVTLPNCPIEIKPHFNPSVGTMFFEESDEQCTYPTLFKLPFFLKRYGPKFQEWSVVAHETRPGHHSQAQGLVEYFHSHCGGLMEWLDEQNGFPAFSEGWALYSENPVMSDDTEIYSNNPMQKYGMLKWQIWRALRLIMDTGLHHRGMKRSEALELLKKFAWDETDFAVKELTRYQSCPGQATAYMIGRLTILELRHKAKRELGKKFDLKDFHYHVLSQGNTPLSFLRRYIEKYIDCTKKESKTDFCNTIAESHNEHEYHEEHHHSHKASRTFFSRSLHRHFA